jgi:glycosidase
MNARVRIVCLAVMLFGCSAAHGSQPVQPAGPSWSWNLPIYETALDVATPSGKFCEFENRLDALRDMGVGVIWFLPIFPRGGNPADKPQSHSAYCVRDYYDVNPHHGTKEGFKHLVAAIHQRGMYVMLDWVPNHTSWGNSLITTHPEFYKKDRTGQIVQAGPWADVAQLDHSNRAVWQYMLEARTYWIKEFGVDGFREDVAGALPQEYWQWLRPRLNAVKPVMLLAEADTPRLHPVFDVTYDCTSQVYFYMIARGTWPASALDRLLGEERRLFPRGSMRMRQLATPGRQPAG